MKLDFNGFEKAYELIGNWLLINSTINSYSGVGYYDDLSYFDCIVQFPLGVVISLSKDFLPD